MVNRFVIVGLALAIAHDAQAKCAMTELEASLVTDPGATVPSDGGVLVGYTAEVERSGGGSHDDADPSITTWKFSVPVERVALAPGLSVYRPKSGASIAITDAKGAAIAKLARDGKATASALPAPMPQKLEIKSFASHRGMTRELIATLSSPPPATAVAVILYSSNAGKVLSFGRVSPSAGGGKSVVPWSDPPRCSFSPRGTTVPTAGDKLVLAWVDQFGRVGKTSAPLGFSATKPAKDDDD